MDGVTVTSETTLFKITFELQSNCLIKTFTLKALDGKEFNENMVKVNYMERIDVQDENFEMGKIQNQ